MNKRISELQSEAFGLCKQVRDDGDKTMVVTDEWFKKFAELIIQDCIDLQQHEDVLAPVGNSAWGEAYQEGWAEGTAVYRNQIKEHFGVE